MAGRAAATPGEQTCKRVSGPRQLRVDVLVNIGTSALQRGPFLLLNLRPADVEFLANPGVTRVQINFVRPVRVCHVHTN